MAANPVIRSEETVRNQILSAVVLGVVSAPSIPAVFAENNAASADQWPTVMGDAGGARFSPLTAIDRGNVGRLQVKWTYRHGDYRSGWPEADVKGTVFEATPILVGGRLVFAADFCDHTRCEADRARFGNREAMPGIRRSRNRKSH